jgi:hypothetical protein
MNNLKNRLFKIPPNIPPKYHRAPAFPPINGIAAMRLAIGDFSLILIHVRLQLAVESAPARRWTPWIPFPRRWCCGVAGFGARGDWVPLVMARPRMGSAWLPLGGPPAVRSAAVAAPMRSKGVGWGWPPTLSQPGLSAEFSIFQFLHVGRFCGSKAFGSCPTPTPSQSLQWV